MLSYNLKQLKISQSSLAKDTLIKLKKPLNLSFASKNSTFEPSSLIQGTKMGDFINVISSFRGALTLNIDQSTKNEVFNLTSAIQSFDNISTGTLDTGMTSYIKYILNETANYAIYKNLSINKDSLKSTERFSAGQNIIFNMASTVAVPANRASQRIGIGNDPIEEPKDEFDGLPPCPCTYIEVQK